MVRIPFLRWGRTLSRRVASQIQPTLQAVAPTRLHRHRWRMLSACQSAIECSTRNLSTSRTTTGLFSIPELRVPADFVAEATRTKKRCDELRGDIQQGCKDFEAASTIHSRHEIAVQLLWWLDRLSLLVCNVIDASELARSVHVDTSWREAAESAFTALSDYIGILNADPSLHEAVVLIRRDVEVWNMLTEEEQRLGLLLQDEFERDGIHLPDDQRDQVRQLLQQLTILESLFSRNLVTQSKSILADAAAVQQVLPIQVLQQFGLQAVNMDGENVVPLSSAQPQIVQTLIKYSSSAALRKHLHIEFNTAVPENLDVLHALQKTRHQLATALDFESYAHYFQRDKMARNPATVKGFLTTLQGRNQPTFAKEMERLSQAKLKLEGSSVLEPWDVPYYVGLLKANEGTDLQHSIGESMTLSQCLQSLQWLVKSLFGIDMFQESLAPEERWDGQVSESGLAKFSFSDNGRPLGTLYLDLHPRQGKYGHAAHFTVRCGCRLSIDNHEDYQLPVVALVCNLSSNDRVSHSEAETLFHEFGHALHSLLSRTTFQHVSGTRAAMDFVETPSHWMEHYVWDPAFLRRLLVGNRISDQALQQFCHSKHDFYAIERQNQILYALFDQDLFGIPTGKTSTELFAGLHKQLAVPYAEGTHWHSRFGHLVTYGAGYYSYLYCQVFAADIYESMADPLDASSGKRLWQSVLAHGGAKDPMNMLTDLLGRPPKIDLDY